MVLGLLLGQGAQWTEAMVLPALAFAMMLSTTSLPGNIFRSPRKLLIPILGGVVMNNGVLGGLILLLNSLAMLEESFRIGFIVLAIAPPAIAVIPFTTFLGGDLEFSVIGTLGCYLGALAITPTLLPALLGSSLGFQTSLLIILVELIVVPLVISRILGYTGLDKRIVNIKGTLVNWSFFVVVYTVTGLNSEVFLNRPLELIPIAAMAIASTFVLGYVITKAGRFLRIDPKKVTSMILLGTLKNTGFSAGLALALFGKQASVPSTIMNISMLAYVILLDLKRNASKKVSD